MSSQNENERKYWGPENQGQRFQIPEREREYQSRYDIPSEVIQDLVQRRPKPFVKHVISLATARAATDPLVIEGPGRGFVVFGYLTSTEATYKTVSSGVILNVRVNEDLPECEWSAKHNRGYRGDFSKLYLSWPAQVGASEAAVSVELYIFKFDDHPFQCGEAAT